MNSTTPLVLTEYNGWVGFFAMADLMRDWFDTVSRLGLKCGTSFD